jgi:hypothetical protein
MKKFAIVLAVLIGVGNHVNAQCCEQTIAYNDGVTAASNASMLASNGKTAQANLATSTATTAALSKQFATVSAMKPCPLTGDQKATITAALNDATSLALSANTNLTGTSITNAITNGNASYNNGAADYGNMFWALADGQYNFAIGYYSTAQGYVNSANTSIGQINTDNSAVNAILNP